MVVWVGLAVNVGVEEGILFGVNVAVGNGDGVLDNVGAKVGGFIKVNNLPGRAQNGENNPTRKKNRQATIRFDLDLRWEMRMTIQL